MALSVFLGNYNTEIASEISHNLYIDNILLDAWIEFEALEKYRQSRELFTKIGMNVREYISNSSRTNSNMQEIDRLDNKEFKLIGVV